jgi:hypothetical protein
MIVSLSVSYCSSSRVMFWVSSARICCEDALILFVMEASYFMLEYKATNTTGSSDVIRNAASRRYLIEIRLSSGEPSPASAADDP